MKGLLHVFLVVMGERAEAHCERRHRSEVTSALSNRSFGQNTAPS
jgi:hypothetical protein